MAGRPGHVSSSSEVDGFVMVAREIATAADGLPSRLWLDSTSRSGSVASGTSPTSGESIML